MNSGTDNPVDWRNRHLRSRCQQRGVTAPDLTVFLEVADHLVPVGRNCLSVTITRRAVQELRNDGVDVAAIERVARRALVIDGEGWPITTLVPSKRRGRRYRHGRSGRSWARP